MRARRRCPCEYGLERPREQAMFSSVTLQQATNWSSVLLITALVSNALPLRAQSEGNVMIRVVDETGSAISSEMGKFTSLDGKVDLTSHFEGPRGTHIPYGAYKYSLWRKLPSVPVQAFERRIAVKLPETLAVVVEPRFAFPSGISADNSTPRGFVIKGKLEPMPAPSISPGAGSDQVAVWIVEVDPSGEFRIFTMLGGRYLLTVISAAEVVHVQEVVFAQGGKSTQFVINLRERQSTPIYVH